MPAHPPRASELIDVRPGERLDAARIAPWLRANLPGAGGELEVVAQFGGGYANLTYLLRCGGREYVLRRPPLGPVAPTAHDMQREHRVLSKLGAAYPLAPRSFALCTDPAVLGVDFHVLERRRGFVIREQLPPDVAGDPVLARRLGEALVDALAALHRVDPAAVGLGGLGRPEGYVERQLAGWTRRWAATGRALPAVDRLAVWLRERRPRQQAATLLHNDFQIENILLDAADPAAIVAVLDWDMCTRGDPLMDLGYLLNCWTDPRRRSRVERREPESRLGARTPVARRAGGALRAGRRLRREARDLVSRVRRVQARRCAGTDPRPLPARADARPALRRPGRTRGGFGREGAGPDLAVRTASALQRRPPAAPPRRRRS